MKVTFCLVIIGVTNCLLVHRDALEITISKRVKFARIIVIWITRESEEEREKVDESEILDPHII